MVVMFVITLFAVGAAVAASLRPMPDAKPATPPTATFSAQHVADAKAKVCAAYRKVQNAVSINSIRTAGDDPSSRFLIAVNMRQVFVAGSAHLTTMLADAPAAPADLAAAKKLAELY
jgi:hypothetical protein